MQSLTTPLNWHAFTSARPFPISLVRISIRDPDDPTGEQLEGAPLIKPSTTDHPLHEAVVEACRTVYDPEIPVNIFDLGLIYTIEIDPENAVNVIMTLTAPGCPVAGECPAGWPKRSSRCPV